VRHWNTSQSGLDLEFHMNSDERPEDSLSSKENYFCCKNSFRIL
jgi:hypothetical protein